MSCTYGVVTRQVGKIRKQHIKSRVCLVTYFYTYCARA